MTDQLNHGPDCDCGCQDELPQITLEFEDGESVLCEPLFVFDFEDQDYIALVPVSDDSDDVFLYVYNELSDEEFEFLDIEDDDLFDRVVERFEEIMDEAEALEENK
ncbi:MAG: DUF1292 domain-containing protein [Parasporobacterium sp.]|nr:DUF1292 domain-containing protein [Parasporobacterium sp.]